jgi:alkylated DNA repair dioxygenase AlkB
MSSLLSSSSTNQPSTAPEHRHPYLTRSATKRDRENAPEESTRRTKRAKRIPLALRAPGPNATLKAHSLAALLGVSPIFLTPDKSSWILHVPHFWDVPSEAAFVHEWLRHPIDRHKLRIHGNKVTEKRWSAQWGISYAYGGSVRVARPIQKSRMVRQLCNRINTLMRPFCVTPTQKHAPYNACLQNWYEPKDSIGLHADNESVHVAGWPIFALSWGGPRRFLLRPRIKQLGPMHEVWLHSGDLIVMGGTCQKTHKHEVPKMRKKDPGSTDRINWTVRAFQPPVP